MKGVIFNLFENFIVKNWDEESYYDIYESVVDQLSTSEPFVGPGTYPDSDFLTLLVAAVKRFKLEQNKAIFAFGRYAFPFLAKYIESHMVQYTHPKELLADLHGIIHVEARKLMKDATPPDFVYQELEQNYITMTYQSSRKLYDLVEGLLQGLADHYNTDIEVRREMLSEEAGECRFHVRFLNDYLV